MILKFMFPKNYFQGERDNPPCTITPWTFTSQLIAPRTVTPQTITPHANYPPDNSPHHSIADPPEESWLS